jgi:hypothetical protein
VVYAPTDVDGNPQLGDTLVSNATIAATTGVFTVTVSGLAPNSVYSYAAYATNSLGISYSVTGIFNTLVNPLSWQQMWFGDPTSSNAALNADPYQTGVRNIQVFAYLGPYQDPSTASPALLPQVQMGGGNLFYSFTEPAGVGGISYGAQWSATMQSNGWHAVPRHRRSHRHAAQPLLQHTHDQPASLHGADVDSSPSPIARFGCPIWLDLAGKMWSNVSGSPGRRNGCSFPLWKGRAMKSPGAGPSSGSSNVERSLLAG